MSLHLKDNYCVINVIVVISLAFFNNKFPAAWYDYIVVLRQFKNAQIYSGAKLSTTNVKTLISGTVGKVAVELKWLQIHLVDSDYFVFLWI